MSLMGVSNKTVVIVNNGGPVPGERKKPKTSLFLSAKIDTPFRGHGGCVLGKIWEWLGLRYWGGLSSHAEGFLFQKTIVWTVNDQEKRETIHIRFIFFKRCNLPEKARNPHGNRAFRGYTYLFKKGVTLHKDELWGQF